MHARLFSHKKLEIRTGLYYPCKKLPERRRIAMEALSPDKTKVAFIGIGVMGKGMSLNLIQKGYTLSAYTRTKSKAQDVLDAGAVWADTIGECVKGAAAVITIVGFPKDVREVYLGEGGIVENAEKGAVIIDMTTSEPTLAKEIHEKASAKGLYALDGPVSGGDVGAREARLSIMVGGDKEAFDAAAPLFEAMGKTVVYQGVAGSGQHTKMCNQIAIASNMIGIMEALLYARRSGLDPETVLSSISAGAAGSWSMSNLLPRVIKGNFDPGFYVEHFLKDIRIALKEAKEMGIRLPGLQLAEELYEHLVQMGGAKLGTQALYKVLEDMASGKTD
jgi:3-hydroxyisobutyrate dehydrogenase